ncbi:MAG: bL35 family ribosomal protein [Dehalococcoidia bacterium]|jgi:ribosomal protein L35
MKTHKGTAKRVRVTATGKVMLRSFNPKRGKRARSKMYGNREDMAANSTLVKAIRKNLPYARPTPAPHKQPNEQGSPRVSTNS